RTSASTISRPRSLLIRSAVSRLSPVSIATSTPRSRNLVTAAFAVGRALCRLERREQPCARRPAGVQPLLPDRQDRAVASPSVDDYRETPSPRRSVLAHPCLRCFRSPSAQGSRALQFAGGWLALKDDPTPARRRQLLPADYLPFGRHHIDDFRLTDRERAGLV